MFINIFDDFSWQLLVGMKLNVYLCKLKIDKGMCTCVETIQKTFYDVNNSFLRLEERKKVILISPILY